MIGRESLILMHVSSVTWVEVIGFPTPHHILQKTNFRTLSSSVRKIAVHKKTGARMNPSWCNGIRFANSAITYDIEGYIGCGFANEGRSRGGSCDGGDDAGFPSECLVRNRNR